MPYQMQFPGLITNQEYQIDFLHVPTKNTVQFPGWVTAFNDQYTSQWNKTPTYGRMDPLSTFQRTERTISLNFDVVAASIAEARVNLDNIGTLVKFLYPTYTGNSRDQQNTLSGGPLLGLRWTNLISDKSGGGRYLYGYLAGLSYGPNVGDGGFLTDPGIPTVNQQATEIMRNAQGATQQNQQVGPGQELSPSAVATGRANSSAFIPKTVSLSLNFTVLHTHLMGWSDGTFGGSDDVNLTFPYMPNQSTNPSAGVAPGAPGEQLPVENAVAEAEVTGE
jgi:hypothetical protein